ncbi:MAG: creatininase family protein [Victivallales bacterium]|nr:creatininase family protein [Victivallales bacterium]
MRMEMALPRELEQAKKERQPLCIPIGVMEYHAAHCALGTDTLIPMELLYRFEKERDIVVAPPVWYGPASYSVAGPEKNSIDIDSNLFSEYIHNILKALLAGGWRNFYLLIIHQTVGCNPTEIACMNAAKKLVFEFMQEDRGKGWWGAGEDSGADSPWNWFHVMSVMPRIPGVEMPLDHAGYHETSLMWALNSSAVNMERIRENREWFCASAENASIEHGEELIDMILDYWRKNIK